MRFSFFLLFILFFSKSAQATFDPPINDELVNAITIVNTSVYCSEDAAYSNIEATPSNYAKPINWINTGKDVWFKFTATKYDVNISVSGKVDASSTNTLINPLVTLYSINPLTNSITETIGSTFTSSNVTSYYKGGLTIGQVYCIRVSAENDATGTFRLCVDNYFPPIQPGQDCATASVLCGKGSFTQLNVVGAGNNNHEAAGTCLNIESNTAWYKFVASKAGTFTFVITPTVTTDDIDWVFYDLGPEGDCSQVNAANAIRCAAGHGITCSPSYYKTGLSMTETDLTEDLGCPPGQNGFVKYVDLIEGHTYALLIDNFSSQNNGFTIEFDGTADFAGPKVDIDVVKLKPCTDDQAYTFSSNSSNYASLKWSFGEGASISSATTEGPFTITYSTPGEKIVVLEAESSNLCKQVTTKTIIVANTPDKPDISISKINLCTGDELQLSTPFVNLATYHWSGPNEFTSNLRTPKIIVTGPENVGVYTLFIQVGDCVSPVNSVNVISVDPIPEAVFSIKVNNKCEANQSFSIINASKNYTKIFWDFGNDVKTNSDFSSDTKILTFNTLGLKTITLTVETNNGCKSVMTKDILTELKPDKPEITVNQPAFCLKDVIKLSVPQQPGISYLWTGPNNFTATTATVNIPVSDFNVAGEYQVVLKSGTCNSTPATIIIPAIANIPVAAFSTDPNFNIKFSAPVPIKFNNNSLYGDTYLWDFGDNSISTDVNPSHNYTTDGTFRITLTAKSNNGCFTSVTHGDLVIKKDASIFTPGAFSPNGDNINDEFVVGITNLKKYRLQIYNRLGSIVFMTDNIFDNWNGTFKGQELPVGVYYFIILGTTLNNNNVKYSGSVTLLR
ncbi:PKD domain-containing protein [Pedobacter nototheniae]|uniref:PKD domain-containing protein n=1 Tax=Pedobacter nototheniae TaxID=2488994 RepID=UPI0010407F47|nr:PKD domain-containing protein [Pedobacter nototheniae]